MYRHGYSVGDAKGRVLQLRMDAQASASPDALSSFLPDDVREDASSPQPDLLTGVSLTLPDGTTVSFFIRNDWRKAPSSYPISDPA